MKRKIFYLLILFLFFSFFSCQKPPENTEEIDYLDFISNNILIITKLKTDKNDSQTIVNEVLNNFKNKIITIKKDSRIILDSTVSTPENDTILYSLENNKFYTNKSFYITLLNNKLVFSLDNENWYYILNDKKKGIDGINYNYQLKSEKNNNNLIINYKISLSLGKSPLIAHPDKKREIFTLAKGMIYSSSIKEIKSESIANKILFIRQGTILSGYHIIRGNLIDSSYINGQIILKSLKTIYLYSKNLYCLSISLDKKNWGMNIFSMETKPSIEIFAKEDNDLFFNIFTSLNYEKDKISLLPAFFMQTLKNK